MQNKIKTFAERAVRMPSVPLLAILGAAAVGVSNALDTSMWESAFSIWFLGAAIFLTYYFRRARFDSDCGAFKNQVAAIVFLAASAISIWLGKNNTSAIFIVLALTLFFGNVRIMFLALIPAVMWLGLIPKTELINFRLSYPMRLIGAHISAAILRIFNFDAEAAGTIVTMGGRDIAVTAACSGIEQLEAMLFVGWIIVVCMHDKLWERLAHFVLILPVILLVNTLRLTVSLAGTEKFGDAFLSDGIHTSLGFVSVALITLIFIGIGSLFVKVKEIGADK